MFAFEVLAAGFFIVLAATAPFARASRRRAWRAIVRALALAGIIVMSTRTLGGDVRVWLGHAYLVSGYWLPALLASGRPPGMFEEWLRRTEERWEPYRVALPRAIGIAVELAYFLCYAFVPAAFLIVWAYGSVKDLDRFWTAVLAAGLACYGTMPWLVSRPPRLLNDSRKAEAGRRPPLVRARGVRSPHGTAPIRLRAINALVLRYLSHGLNTFPSGHVAVAVAAGLMVLPIAWPAGLAMCVFAGAIAVGAVAGRYHYTIDVLWGTAVGIAAAFAASAR